MKFTKIHQKKWDTFKKEYLKKKKKFRLVEPRWSFGLDKNTKSGTIKLCYTIPYQNVDDKLRYKHKQEYLKTRTFQELDLLLQKEELERYHSHIIKENETIIRTFNLDNKSIDYWVEKYVKRGGTEIRTLALKSIQSDETTLKDFLDYIKNEKPKCNDIYRIDRNLVKSYLTFRMKVGGKKKKWSTNTVHSYYCRIRAFYNWMTRFEDLDLERYLLNGMGIELPKKTFDTSSFSPSEINKVFEFMQNEIKSNEWFWFIPMFNVLLLTGCRLSEVVYMKIDDVDLDSQEWFFRGKGDKKRRTKFQDNQLWDQIKERIIDDSGHRYEKEYVFHRMFIRKSNKGKGVYDYSDVKGNLIEDFSIPYHLDGFRKKFRKMVHLLNINPKITPHSCRRFFITEMLKETNGNIPLVAQLVGHNDWSIVRRYSKDVILDDTKTNLNLKKVISRTT
jgi:integrase